MRKLLYVSVFSLFLWSCGGGDDNPPTPPIPVNKTPTTPTLLEPTNGLLCIDNTVQFKWNESTDPDGDNITYEIQVSKDNSFTQIVNTFSESTTTKTISLEKGISYYWRVKSTDNKDESNYSSIFNFYTEGEGITNYLPFSPELDSPELNSVVQQSTTTLKWKTSDVDTGDTLTFEIYFGMIESNIKDENQVDLLDLTEYTITQDETDSTKYILSEISISSSSNYYWKVIVNDGNGGQTKGHVWNFKTD